MEIEGNPGSKGAYLIFLLVNVVAVFPTDGLRKGEMRLKTRIAE